MSIFSSIRNSRRQAKEHKAKLAEQREKEQQQQHHPPYRHVPTHAAVDAFASAPPAWREAADRPRVLQENQRRSIMASKGHDMNIPGPVSIYGTPRVASRLSYVTYPGRQPAQVQIPRIWGQGSFSYPQRSQDVIYSFEPVVLPEVPRNGISQQSSSSDELKMKMPIKPFEVDQLDSRRNSQLIIGSRPRRNSESSVDQRIKSNQIAYGQKVIAASPSVQRGGPHPSTRGFGFIPQSDGFPPLKIDTRHQDVVATSNTSEAAGASTNLMTKSRQTSESSLPELTPTSTKQQLPDCPASPPGIKTPSYERASIDLSFPTPNFDWPDFGLGTDAAIRLVDDMGEDISDKDFKSEIVPMKHQNPQLHSSRKSKGLNVKRMMECDCIEKDVRADQQKPKYREDYALEYTPRHDYIKDRSTKSGIPVQSDGYVSDVSVDPGLDDYRTERMAISKSVHVYSSPVLPIYLDPSQPKTSSRQVQYGTQTHCTADAGHFGPRKSSKQHANYNNQHHSAGYVETNARTARKHERSKKHGKQQTEQKQDSYAAPAQLQAPQRTHQRKNRTVAEVEQHESSEFSRSVFAEVKLSTPHPDVISWFPEPEPSMKPLRRAPSVPELVQQIEARTKKLDKGPAKLQKRKPRMEREPR